MTQIRSEVLANGMLFDGRQFRVSRVEHDRELRGVGTESFTVDVLALGQTDGLTVGFATEAEAFNYIHSNEDDPYSDFDWNGDEVKVTRRGLGIPASLLNDRRKTKTAKGKAAGDDNSYVTGSKPS